MSLTCSGDISTPGFFNIFFPVVMWRWVYYHQWYYLSKECLWLVIIITWPYPFSKLTLIYFMLFWCSVSTAVLCPETFDLHESLHLHLFYYKMHFSVCSARQRNCKSVEMHIFVLLAGVRVKLYPLSPENQCVWVCQAWCNVCRDLSSWSFDTRLELDIM